MVGVIEMAIYYNAQVFGTVNKAKYFSQKWDAYVCRQSAWFRL